ALRELTGEDAGDRTEAWQELYPRAQTDVAAARLSGELKKADPVKRELLLAKLRDGDGRGHTEALAGAIPGLQGAFQEKAREALAKCLARLPAEELRARLQDGDPEVRRAAARACVEKKDADAVPALTDLLEDADPLVARQAEAALKSLAVPGP